MAVVKDRCEIYIIRNNACPEKRDRWHSKVRGKVQIYHRPEQDTWVCGAHLCFIFWWLNKTRMASIGKRMGRRMLPCVSNLSRY